MGEETRGFARLIETGQIYVKMGFLLALVLALLIPLQLVKSVISERAERRDTVVSELSETWGRPQVLSGPVLIVPYRTHVERVDPGMATQRTALKDRAYFLPEDLSVTAATEPEVRYRGIFEAILYNASLQMSGSFTPPDFARLGIAQNDVLWDEAVLAFGVTDLRGAGGEPKVTWDGEQIAFVPGTGSELLGSGIHIPLALERERIAALPFSFDLSFTGSGSISFTPAAKTSRVALTSSWPHPSFVGAYLPAERAVTQDGFTARWNVSYLGRDFPQQWAERSGTEPDLGRRVAQSRFGVALITPVDFYLKSERSVKHGALLILLVVAAIFIFEVVAAVRIHIFQYALVGFALSIFYLLLLSISELAGFFVAYGIAATLSTAMITLYIGKAMASRRRALIIAGILAAVYAYLYVVLQLEAFALLAGAVGLFVALAAVMYATRNVNWYTIGNRQVGPPSQASRSGQA